MSAICLLVALWCAVLLSHSAAAEERHEYDPATCNSGAQGKLYIALGRYVLATPYSKSGVYMQDPLRPGDIGLVALDPTEPMGCPGNPLQSWSYEFIYALQAIGAVASGAGAGSNNQQADRLTLYRALRNSPSPRPDDPEWPGADFMLLRWDMACKAADVHEELPNGLTACRIRPKADTREENWGTTYRARSDIYTTPLGKPFIVDCGPMLFQDAISHCDVAYTIMPGLGVGYRFQPYLGAHHIPIDGVIEYDRGLRTVIEGMVIKDYAWKGEAPVGAPAK
jgi:hypothetical protein